MHSVAPRFVVAACLCLAAGGVGRAQTTTSIWSFAADYWVTVVEPLPDVSDPGNGGADLLVGSADDTLYLVEGRGAASGGELWKAPAKSTVSALKALPDVNRDGRADVAAGDMGNFVQCISGGSGQVFWAYVTRGAILDLAVLPDVSGDGASEVLAACEDDTLYCLSGAVPGMTTEIQRGECLWKFGMAAGKETPRPAALPKTAAGGPVIPPGGGGGNPKGKLDRPQGANAVAVLLENGAKTFGVVVGSSNDTVYCLAAGQGPRPAQIWKTGVPGDVWDLAASRDIDGDNIQDVVIACGADVAYALSGRTGKELWSCAASGGAQVVAVPGDVNGDGADDAVVGDGYGSVRCVSGKARGSSVAPLWRFSTGDTGTVTAIAAASDVDGNGKPEVVVGTSDDEAYLVSDAGKKLWHFNAGGTVFSVASFADANNDGIADVAVGSGNSVALVLSATPASASYGAQPRPGRASRLAGGSRASTGGATSPGMCNLRGAVLRGARVCGLAGGAVLDAKAAGRRVWMAKTAFR